MILLCVLCLRQSSLPGILFFCVPVALGTSLCFPLWLHCSLWGCLIPDSHLMHEGQSFTSHPCGEEHSSAECAKGQRGDIRRNQGKQEYWRLEKSADDFCNFMQNVHLPFITALMISVESCLTFLIPEIITLPKYAVLLKVLVNFSL